ncbi:MAG TPA: translocation/assembly module TamB domain-containing protein [Anaeromyxobacter sp.]|nr:translocation/assembly module TamB domain-containing protein [Anaeromyxobacter sp.]
MKKRTLALAFLGFVLALAAATLGVLRTRWAGERICALAAARAQDAAGVPLAFRTCRVSPLALELVVEGLRVGPPAAPLLQADAASARLAPIQALGGRVQLAEVRAVNPRLVAAIPAGGSGGGGGRCASPVPEDVDVERVEIQGGSLDLALPGGVRLAARGIDATTRPAARTLRSLAAPLRRARLEVSAASLRLEGLDDRPLAAARVAVAADVAVDLSSAEVVGADAEVDGVRVDARGRIGGFCAPELDLVATASGRFRDVLALARIARDADADGKVFAEAKVTGPAAHPSVSGKLRLEKARVAWFTPGDVRADVHLAGRALAVDRLEWPYGAGRVSGRGTVGLALPVQLEAEVDLDGVDLAEILERVDVAGSWVTVKLDGKGRLGGTLAPPSLAGTLAGEFRDLRALTRSWRIAPLGERGVVNVKRGRIQGGVRVTEEALSFDAARVSAGRGTSDVDAVARFGKDGGYSVRWRGAVDLDAMGAIAGIPWSGLAHVDGTISSPTYANPRVVARGTRIEGFRFLDLDLGNAAADVLYGPDFLVRIQDGQGVKGQSRYRGEAVVDLEPVPPRVLSSRLQGEGRVRDLLDAVRDYVPSTRVLRDRFDGDVQVSGTATGKAGALDGTFEGRLGTGVLFGRPFDSGRAAGAFRNGAVARLERAELRRGPGAVRWSGWWGFQDPIPWDLEVAFAGVPLDALGLPGGGWAGSASGTAALKGSFEYPDVRFAANGDGVSFHGVGLGTVQVGGTVHERSVLATATSDAVQVQGEATLDGRMPFRARAELALEDVARLVPGGAPAGLRAKVRGEATAEGELANLAAARARLRLDAVEAGHADFKVEAAGPVVVTVSRGRVDVQELVLRGSNTELTLSGSGAESGEIDLSAAGTVDLRLLAGLVPDLKRPHGLLTLEALVSGTARDPVLVGAGRLDDVGFQLKGTNVLLSELRGDLAFSQNRILFDQLSGAVNGGRAVLGGEVELASFAPVRHRLDVRLDEVPVAVPAWLPTTLSGRLEVAGTLDDTAVTGRLHVVRARYTANLDLERSLLQKSRKPPPPPRPYDKAGEWLRLDVQIAVDGDARVENDVVSGDVRGDLTLTGTSAAPGLVGTLALSDGSRVRFRGNEFALSHAVLDFTDRGKIEIALDVHGESQVRDYQIFLHAFGPLSDPQLTLTSAPPLSQPDIITLLSLGFTRRDASASAGVQGMATAAAAQAIFSASGLDEQVRRFVPRGEVVRDIDVRITSEWSESSGQVEPRAEVESLLLKDRLRLRYQAPLSGGRGQKAQAELRLGSHSSVQYQWDNDNPDVQAGDHGLDLKLRWEWTDR